ncbi:Oidioi.mRNA.OKI2018_I69.PAR.g9510.t1.cds [Oikopleura dioica]|uniref:Oidioi.mRNA.OKI2018_I69.PAR.g9510.t1.cds n=1 Tax=Oikopleura dioica TaxID=34765 RepID=A0ABN7RRT7_OIKDI|nr:Oidioi.mRNA.OKI2018_I69.PAR.g9510.t1.cds [Oikopleura dioica]
MNEEILFRSSISEKELYIIIICGLAGAVVLLTIVVIILSIVIKNHKRPKSCEAHSQTEVQQTNQSFTYMEPAREMKRLRSPSLQSPVLSRSPNAFGFRSLGYSQDINLNTFPKSTSRPNISTHFHQLKPPKSDKMPRKMIFTEEDVKQFSPDLGRAPLSASSPHTRSRSEPAKESSLLSTAEVNEFFNKM